MIFLGRFLFLLAALIVPSYLFAQEKQDTTKQKTDTTRTDTTRVEQIIQNIKKGKVPKRVLRSITRKKSSNPTLAVRSEDAFMPFEGKIIRKIEIRQVGFDKTVYDT